MENAIEEKEVPAPSRPGMGWRWNQEMKEASFWDVKNVGAELQHDDRSKQQLVQLPQLLLILG